MLFCCCSCFLSALQASENVVFSVRMSWYSNTSAQGAGVDSFIEGSIATVAELIAETNQPRLAQLWRRLAWVATNSLTCSLCGPGSYAYWSCTHCHISLCPRCYISATLPDEASLDLPSENQRILPPSSDCRALPLPALRGHRGVSSVPVAGSPTDRSIVLAPFAWVTVSGLEGEHRVAAPAGDGRTALLMHGHGVHRFVVDCSLLKPVVGATSPFAIPLAERVGAVRELVAGTCVTRLVIDLRCHATESGYQFGRAVLKLSAVSSISRNAEVSASSTFSAGLTALVGHTKRINALHRILKLARKVSPYMIAPPLGPLRMKPHASGSSFTSFPSQRIRFGVTLRKGDGKSMHSSSCCLSQRGAHNDPGIFGRKVDSRTGGVGVPLWMG